VRQRQQHGSISASDVISATLRRCIGKRWHQTKGTCRSRWRFDRKLAAIKLAYGQAGVGGRMTRITWTFLCSTPAARRASKAAAWAICLDERWQLLANQRVVATTRRARQAAVKLAAKNSDQKVRGASKRSGDGDAQTAKKISAAIEHWCRTPRSLSNSAGASEVSVAGNAASSLRVCALALRATSAASRAKMSSSIAAWRLLCVSKARK